MGVETLLQKEEQNGEKYLKECGFSHEDEKSYPLIKQILSQLLSLENRLLLSNMQQEWIKEEALKSGFCHSHYTYTPLPFKAIKRLLNALPAPEEGRSFYSFYSPLGLMGFCAHLLKGYNVKEFQNLCPHKEIVQHLVNKYDLKKSISTHYLSCIEEDFYDAQALFIPSLMWDYSFKEQLFSKLYQQLDRKALLLTNALPPKKFLSYFSKIESITETSSYNPQQHFYLCQKKSPSIDAETCFLSWLQP